MSCSFRQFIQTDKRENLHAVGSYSLKTVHATFISFKLEKFCGSSFFLHFYETSSSFPPRMPHTINASYSSECKEDKEKERSFRFK